MSAHHRPSLLERRRRGEDNASLDPMQPMGNLFDVAVLIAVGFLIVALSGFGLRELLSAEDVTIVKNPGTPEMEIIRKEGREIERLTTTDAIAEGSGTPIGTVFRLEDGRVIWVPDNEE
jgi:hypothetical protein